MKEFLQSNETQWRLLRTIVQGLLGVIIANLDFLFGLGTISAEWKSIIVMAVMCVLSPIMSLLKGEPIE